MVVPLITAGAAAVGAGMSIFGGIGASKAAKEQAKYAAAQAQVANQQLELGVKQLDNNVDMAHRQEVATDLQMDFSRGQYNIELQAEGLRKRAMESDAQRNILEQVRMLQRARSAGLATATAQGASSRGGSAVNALSGQAQGQGGSNVRTIADQLDIGRTMFALNQQLGVSKMNLAEQLYSITKQNFTDTYENFAYAKGSMQLDMVMNNLKAKSAAAGAKGQEYAAIAGVGGQIMGMSGTIGQLGGNMFSGSFFGGGPTAMSHTGFGPGSGYNN